MAKFYSSLTEIKSGLLRAEITVQGLVKNYLGEIKKNAHLNAFNEVFEKDIHKYLGGICKRLIVRH